MSETTLTKDEITELRRKCPTHGQLGLNGEMLTKLLDAAERAETLEADCEVERMRLAACMTAALGNTRDAVEHRITRENPYWSAAYGDVCRAVDAEIALREERDALAAQLTEVTRERDELLRQRNSYPSDFDPSLRQHERDVTEIVELRASLAPLRAVAEKAEIASNAYDRLVAEQVRVFGAPITHGGRAGQEMNVFIADCKHLFEAVRALPADPSAPTSSDSVTRAQAEQRLTTDLLEGLFVRQSDYCVDAEPARKELIDALFPAPTSR